MRSRLVAFFAALCLFLAAVEYAVPKPLPFLRLGLTNLPVILSLKKMRHRETLLLVLLKIVGQGILTGTIFSYVFVFSAAGSLASAVAMLTLYAAGKRAVSAVGLSLAGALANNLAQLALARGLLFGVSARYIAPVLLTTGFISAVLLGIVTERFMRKSRWFASLPQAAANGAGA
ncbi:MAG: Gx transporter family protein [Treponemataceae bacterium]|nr:Gx transporter family protein [Treponemataceae bacterium]